MTPEEIAVSALAKLNDRANVGTMKGPGGDIANAAGNTKPSSATPAKKPRRTKKVHSYPVEPVVISSIPKQKGVMNHSYRDFSNVPPELNYEAPASIEDMTFSQKVHHILSQEEYAKMIRWNDHGRSFKVFVPVMFERTICAKYFGHKRYSSFLRQLNNNGFKHTTKGDDRNSYYHEVS